MEEVYDTTALVSDDAKLKEEEEEKKIQKMKCDDEDDDDGDDEKNKFAIQNLPEGAIAHIFSLLPALSVINCMLTSKQLYRAAVSDGTCWKRQCEKLANIESLDDLRAKARRDIFMNSAKDEEKVKESGEYYRKVFIEMQKNPLMRYRFLKMIPTCIGPEAGCWNTYPKSLQIYRTRPSRNLAQMQLGLVGSICTH